MDSERWQRIDRLFHGALQRESGERAAFLSEACAGDDSLRREVQSLLESHEQSENFIEAPAADLAAELLASGEARLTPGQSVGPYKIVSLLGEGGMGEVYLAEDLRLGRQVALKRLPAQFALSSERVRRFEQEARAASALNHPNIVTIHEIGHANSVHFITTEFIDGKTLRQQMATGRMKLDEVLDIAAQVASALAAAHAAGIVHRDIKPDNVMIRRDRIVKVLDFGLAKLTLPQGAPVGSEAATKSMVKTNPGMVMGTVQYMSPEQARGQQVDERTDIWSLGVVLYEMVSGRVPFEGETPSHVIVSVLENEPTPMGRHSEVSAELDRIVTKALRKDKQERYQTASDLALDLKSLKQELEGVVRLRRSHEPNAGSKDKVTKSDGRQTDDPVHASAARTLDVPAGHPTSSAEYLVSEIKRHKRGVLFALALLVLAGAGVGYWLYKSIGQNKSLASSSAMRITRLTSTGRATRAAISPDGKYVVYAQDEAGQQSLWLNQVAISSNVQIVPPAAVTYEGITFSRDGNLIYYVRTEPNDQEVLYQAPALGVGGERKLLFNVHSPITLSPDGKRSAFLRRYPTSPGGDAVIVANADGTQEKTLFTLKPPNLFGSAALAWSPDGKIIACGVQNYSGSVYSSVIGVRVADGTETPITSQQWGDINIGRLAWLADGTGLIVTVGERSASLSQVWHLAYPDGKARRIVNDLNEYADVSLTADSSTLAAVRTDRLVNIWVAPSGDAGRAKQVTSGAGREDGVFGGLDWTPDGRIVYKSIAGGNPNIWIMAADGTGNKQLSVNVHNMFPSVSPDGRYVVWASRRTDAGVNQLWRTDIDGGNPKELTQIGGAGIWFPQFSPDGKWVVYGTIGGVNDYHSLWKVPIDGGDPIQLTQKPSWVPVISPDEELIACNWLDEISGQWKIAVLPFAGGLPVKIFDIQGAYNRLIRWTPDGRAVAFVRTKDAITNIWAQPLDGSVPKQLTDFKDQLIFNFAWSRDGKQLALSRGTVNSDVVLISGFK